jgi:hypothetical protein
LRHPALVEVAFGIPALAVLATLDVECASVDRLAEATAAAFTQHLDHRIISFVGHAVADLAGARLLAEIGDDRTQSADARALKAFAGSAPVTKACGSSIRITHGTCRLTGWPPSDWSGPSGEYGRGSARLYPGVWARP